MIQRAEKQRIGEQRDRGMEERDGYRYLQRDELGNANRGGDKVTATDRQAEIQKERG